MRKRALPVLTFLFLALPAAALAESYGWTISASSSSPNEHTGPATSGVVTLYLWYDCAQNGGMAAAEFDIDARGMTHLATTTKNHFLNAGGVSNLLLAIGGCPEGPIVAAELLVIDTPGSLCFTASRSNGIEATVDCTAYPELWGFGWVGYTNSGGDPCAQGTRCHSIHMREASLGKIKDGYKTP